MYYAGRISSTFCRSSLVLTLLNIINSAATVRFLDYGDAIGSAVYAESGAGSASHAVKVSYWAAMLAESPDSAVERYSMCPRGFMECWEIERSWLPAGRDTAAQGVGAV